MALFFAEDSLATVCNSLRKMERRWGAGEAGRVARRLCELDSVGHLEDLVHLAAAHVAETEGEHVVQFGDGVVVRFRVDTHEVAGVRELALVVDAIEVAVGVARP